MTVDESVVISRPLTVVEDFFRSRTASGNFRNFLVTGTYNNSLTQDFNLFFKALRKTILDYHILATNVQFDKTAKKFAFVPLKSLRLKDVLVVQDEGKWITDGRINEQYMKFCNGTQFPLYEESPLFKLVLVGDKYLSVILEHTIADGVVANYFHEIFLENLAHCESVDDKEFIDKYGPIPDQIDLQNTTVFNFEKDKQYIRNSLPPPIDYFLEDIDLDYSYGDPNFQEKIFPKQHPNKWKGRFNTVDRHDIGSKLINFTPQETKQILASCKRYGVSLTPYIEIIHALTMQPVFGDEEYTTHRTAMTLRRHLTPELAPEPYKKILSDPKYKIFGTMAHMGFAQNFPPIKEFSWELVQKVSTDLANAVKNKRALNQLKYWKDNGDSLHKTNDAFFQANTGKPKADAVKISNLGFIKVPEYPVANSDKKWTITDMIFSQDMAPYASEFMLSVVSTPLGGMNFVESFYDYSFDDGDWENFDHFIVQLRENMLKYAQT
ncbi:hypothetical protein SBY92_000185 [Candida maltosa Xu316]|uniref:Putative alcohol acetyltransferase n=1 Tax=Candida maltosa (strain Xu316) TaxID=1245528 RepID=M3JE78_CANMX|nr:putative alcohol acetyltransferase [Candida maltosa Xu316]